MCYVLLWGCSTCVAVAASLKTRLANTVSDSEVFSPTAACLRRRAATHSSAAPPMPMPVLCCPISQNFKTTFQLLSVNFNPVDGQDFCQNWLQQIRKRFSLWAFSVLEASAVTTSLTLEAAAPRIPFYCYSFLWHCLSDCAEEREFCTIWIYRLFSSCQSNIFGYATFWTIL